MQSMAGGVSAIKNLEALERGLLRGSDENPVHLQLELGHSGNAI